MGKDGEMLEMMGREVLGSLMFEVFSVRSVRSGAAVTTLPLESRRELMILCGAMKHEFSVVQCGHFKGGH